MQNSSTQGESTDYGYEHDNTPTNLMNSVPRFHAETTTITSDQIDKSSSKQIENINCLLKEFQKSLNEIKQNQTIILDMIEKSNEKNYNLQKTFEDIYTELLLIKKSIKTQQKQIIEPINKKYPEFPLQNIKNLLELDKKLRDKKFFDDLKSVLIDHVKKINPDVLTIKEFFRNILQIIFHVDIVKYISWKPFPQKTALSCSNLIDLIQSKYDIGNFLIFIES